ncbi:HAD-IA family hydrolase [Streptomyces ovatisporus]|uniref:HAD-IA family hydrolase n=1 Tax=Streptomyces ovatisporus TaxID=1128682 RepID=A0ABV9A222_9ACTN
MLCDIDNVIRFYDHAELARLERESGLTPGITAQVAFEPAIDHPLLLGRIGKQEWVESIARGLRTRAPVSEDQARELGTALATAPFRADATVVGMLQRVRVRMPLVLVSNASLELEEELASLGLSQLAHHVVDSARTGVVKPDRRIYEIAAERAGAAVGRCLFVDDRRENVDAAVAMGMTGAHYREHADLREALGPLLEAQAGRAPGGAGERPGRRGAFRAVRRPAAGGAGDRAARAPDL